MGARHDNDVWWAGVYHDSFDKSFRSIFGAVSPKQRSLTLRIQTCKGDLDSVRVRLWDDRINREQWLTMVPDVPDQLRTEDPLQSWKVTISIPSYPTILYYFFELNDGADRDYYVDDDVVRYGGGPGSMSEEWDDHRGYQITVYSPDFSGDQFLHRKTEEYRNQVRRKLHAYHVHVQIGLNAQGALQILSMTSHQLVWKYFGSWIRTIRPNILPSEAIVMSALRNTLPEFLKDSSSDSILAKFIVDKLDLSRAEGQRMIA